MYILDLIFIAVIGTLVGFLIGMSGKCQKKTINNVHFPKFTFDDVLALQCCMETVKKVQEDKELYEQLNLIHDKIHDAYWLGKQGETSPILSNSSNTGKDEQN